MFVLTTDVVTLIADILRFASLLKRVGVPGPSTALHFEDRASKLSVDSSPEAVDEAAEWLYMMLKHTGNGSIFDRYVSGEEYGSVDDSLTDEYLHLAGKLRTFGEANMGKSVVSKPAHRKWSFFK